MEFFLIAIFAFSFCIPLHILLKAKNAFFLISVYMSETAPKYKVFSKIKQRKENGLVNEMLSHEYIYK